MYVCVSLSIYPPLSLSLSSSIPSLLSSPLVSSQLMSAMDQISGGPGMGKIVSLLEGGYDTQPQTLGLARCVDAHVKALRNGGH